MGTPQHKQIRNYPLMELCRTLEKGDLFKVDVDIYAQTLFGTWHLALDDDMLFYETKDYVKSTLQFKFLKKVQPKTEVLTSWERYYCEVYYKGQKLGISHKGPYDRWTFLKMGRGYETEFYIERTLNNYMNLYHSSGFKMMNIKKEMGYTGYVTDTTAQSIYFEVLNACKVDELTTA